MIDSAEPEQRPLLLTTTGGLLTSSLLLPPGVLGDINNEAGFSTLHTPTGDRELVMERGILWRDLSDSVEWDTVLSQLRSVTSANYRRAMGRQHVGTGQTPTFDNTRLKYADHFVEWQPISGDFRTRPRETRIRIENGQEVHYQGDKKVASRDVAEGVRQLNSPAADAVPSDTSDNATPESALDYYEPFPTDHVVQVNRLPIRTPSDFHHAMRSLESNSGDIQFVVVDNRSGHRIHYKTRMHPQSDRDFGIKPWFWKDSFVVIHEVRPGSPAARAKATRIVKPDLPREIGLGIRGSLVTITDPLRDGNTMVGVKVTEVTEPHRSDLKPGDIVFVVDGNNFNSAQGYQYAVKNAGMLAGIWYVDGRTGQVEHGVVSLPHSPPEEFVEPPAGTGTISITPANVNSCPIW